VNYNGTPFKKFVIARQPDGTYAAWWPVSSGVCEYGLHRKRGFVVDDKVQFFIDSNGHPSRIICKIESKDAAEAAIDKYIKNSGTM